MPHQPRNSRIFTEDEFVTELRRASFLGGYKLLQQAEDTARKHPDMPIHEHAKGILRVLGALELQDYGPRTPEEREAFRWLGLA